MNKHFNLAITGDTHGDIDFDKMQPYFIPYVSEDLQVDDIDIMFICGDAGFVWDGGNEDNKMKEKISALPYTLLCVLGNHENYDIIDNMPIEEWNGIKVRRVTNNCFYLVSPQIFTLNNKTFFIMNGASSIDKSLRKPHISWWEHELPTDEEIEQAKVLLEQHNNKVDYIITHCAPTKVLYQMFNRVYPQDLDKLNAFFDYVDAVVDYQNWWCGHYHITQTFYFREGTKRLLYNWIDKITC